MTDIRFPLTITSHSSALFSVCHLPKEASPSFPAVVMCHGLGGDKAGRGRFSVLLSERLAQSGIASIRFDFRGSGDSEGDFAETTPERCVQDLSSILQWVYSQEMFKSRRYALFGRSFGGLIALLGASQIPGCCAIGVQAPPFSASLFSEGMKEGIFPHLQTGVEQGSVLFEGEPLSKEFLTQLQEIRMEGVMNSVREIPFLHISCGKDRIVDERHTKLFQDARAAASAPTRFVFLKDADHACSQYCDRQTALQESTEWFISHF